MKIALTYYSFSGKTKKVNEYLKEQFMAKGHQADCIPLLLQHEERAFLKQGRAAHLKEMPLLRDEVHKDLSCYDFVILSSPVWAFTFAPALRTYVTQCRGLRGKMAAVFLTCGAVFSSGNALKELESVAREQGSEVVFAAYVLGNKTKDMAYLDKIFKPLLEIHNRKAG